MWPSCMATHGNNITHVNNAIDPKMSSLTYTKVDDLANEAAQMGKGTLMAKMDVEEACRIIPIHPDDRQLLGIYWDRQVYMDAALPFGLRSAPLIFTALADGAAVGSATARDIFHCPLPRRFHNLRSTGHQPTCR